MKFLFTIGFAVSLSTGGLVAQDIRWPQFHGFVTEAFSYTGGNNYLGMNTNAGSPAWIEAAVNGNEQITDNLRIGAQVHLTKLGAFGASGLDLDWALADFRIKEWLGVRAGKVKIRWGLYNDLQDADPGYVWSLLPEPIYAVDWRATNLSQMGAELYGKVGLPSRVGALEYSIYYGYYRYAAHDGYMETYKEEGLNFRDLPGGITPGFDLRWRTPVKGFTLGGSVMLYNAKGNLVNGSFREPLTYWPTYYVQYNRKKFFASAQYVRLVQYNDVATDGQPFSSSLQDTRSWFVMTGYNLTNKLRLGVYRTQYFVAGADLSNPANYFRDWTFSGRYDFNVHFYCKLEGHLIDGTGGGFYGFDNPNGLLPQTKLLVAKAGFIF